MTDRRIDVVAEVLEAHPWFEDDGCCECGWRYGVAHPTDPSHEYHQAIAVIAALDIAARRRPFIGIVPPVRALNERDTPGVYPGLDEFHPSTTHRPEAM